MIVVYPCTLAASSCHGPGRREQATLRSGIARLERETQAVESAAEGEGGEGAGVGGAGAEAEEIKTGAENGDISDAQRAAAEANSVGPGRYRPRLPCHPTHLEVRTLVSSCAHTVSVN